MNRLYFNWLCDFVCTEEEKEGYEKLLKTLFNTEFYALLPLDNNRISDGLSLRKEYGGDIFGPCSILEMMIALARRCEFQIMNEEALGDRSGTWFWIMFDSLGLSDMNNEHFDEEKVERVLSNFLERKYGKDGKGGLFTVQNPPKPVQKVEIWYQMNWFLVQNFG